LTAFILQACFNFANDYNFDELFTNIPILPFFVRIYQIFAGFSFLGLHTNFKNNHREYNTGQSDPPSNPKQYLTP